MKNTLIPWIIGLLACLIVVNEGDMEADDAHTTYSLGPPEPLWMAGIAHKMLYKSGYAVVCNPHFPKAYAVGIPPSLRCYGGNDIITPPAEAIIQLQRTVFIYSALAEGDML